VRRRRIIRSLTGADIAVEPSDLVDTLTLCTDAPSDYLGMKSTHSMQYCVVQTMASELTLKRRFIRCWSNSFGASLCDLNVNIKWTTGKNIRSSSAEEVELWTLLLPNLRSPNEPMLGPSVHPTVSFENSSCKTHPTNVEKRASVHLTLWLKLQLIQFNRLWVFRQFFCFYFASMITLSWLTSKVLEFSYFHGLWCMVKLLVHEPLLIVWLNTTK
jgi:hypothetical protein